MPTEKNTVPLFLLLALTASAFAGDLHETPLVPETTAEACTESLAEPLAPASTGLKFVPLSPSKRLFGVIPNYRAEQIQKTYKPLTAQEKYAIARSDSFDWPNYLMLAGFAMQAQVASGGFSHNGGFKSFSAYYARSVGDQIIGSYVTEAILPSLFHEDPRFFRLGTGSFVHRAYNAVSRIVIAQKDDGRHGFNFSELVGNAGVVAATSFYYPASQSPSEGFERLAMSLGNDMISNMLTEFWPDIKRHLPFQHRTAFK